jgi:hypothetical protein
VGVGGVWVFLRDKVKEPVGGLFLAGESDGGLAAFVGLPDLLEPCALYRQFLLDDA